MPRKLGFYFFNFSQKKQLRKLDVKL